MPVATSEQYAAMLDAAAGGGYAYPAVNVTSSETLNGTIRGFVEAGSDGIVEITTGGSAFLSGSSVKDMALGGRAFAEYAHVVAEASDVLIGLHTDHATHDKFDGFVRPLIEESRHRQSNGREPLFNSHMFDGSTLPLEENLAYAGPLLDELAALGIVLEVECGVVGGEEDGVIGPEGSNEELYTTPEEMLRVAEVLGTGEKGRYMLAATFGNVHGVYKPGHVKLRPEVLRQGQEMLAQAYDGARFDYVFHGSSGSSAEEVHDAIGYGVVKINLDTDAQYAFTRAVADHMFSNYDGVLRVDDGLGRKSAFDPRVWAGKGEAALAARITQAAELFGCAGKSLAQ